jgi:MFS family permease
LLLLPEMNWLIILLAGTLFFAGFNYMEAHMPVMVSSIAPAGTKGSAMGIYASFQFFGAFLGGLISGILNGWLGPKLALVACLIFIVIAMIIVWGLQKATKAKRITLSIENTNVLLQGVNQMQLKSQLQKLNGVQEVLIDVEKNAVYLKIDNTGFDIEKAKSLIK